MSDLLTDQQVDRLLADLACAADELAMDADRMERAEDALAEAEQRVWQLARRHAAATPPPDPIRAALSVRGEVINHAEFRYRRASRQFLAWWADIAACAVITAVTGTPFPTRRAAAADPSAYLTAREWAALPEPTEHERAMTRLTAALTTLPRQRDAEAPTASPDEHDPLPTGGSPELSRRSLWGQVWTACEAPLLPDAALLFELLTRHGVPAVTASPIRDATRVVEELTAAGLRAHALDAPDPPLGLDVIDEIDTLRGRMDDELPGALAHYARTLTSHLPELRQP